MKKMQKANREQKVTFSLPQNRILRTLATAVFTFTVSVLLSSFVLLKTEDPDSFIGICAVCAMAVTSFFSSVVFSHGCKDFRITGGICGLVIVLLLFLLSAVFGEIGKDIFFTAILYLSVVICSIAGAKASCARHGRKRKKR